MISQHIRWSSSYRLAVGGKPGDKTRWKSGILDAVAVPRLADSLHLEQVRHKDDFYQQWLLHHKSKSSSWLLQSKYLNYLKSVWCVTWCTIFPWCAALKDVWPCFKRPGWSSPAETVLNCKKIVARQGIFLHKKPQKGRWKVRRTWPPLCSQEN